MASEQQWVLVEMVQAFYEVRFSSKQLHEVTYDHFHSSCFKLITDVLNNIQMVRCCVLLPVETVHGRTPATQHEEEK